MYFFTHSEAEIIKVTYVFLLEIIVFWEHPKITVR